MAVCLISSLSFGHGFRKEATAMGMSRMGAKDGELIESVGQMVGKFTGELYPKLGMREKRLMESPESLEMIEREVQEAFLHGAGMITSGLIAVVLLSQELELKSEQTRRNFGYPLARGRNRDLRIRLLGGFFMWVSLLYCEPKQGVFRRARPGAFHRLRTPCASCESVYLGCSDHELLRDRRDLDS